MAELAGDHGASPLRKPTVGQPSAVRRLRPLAQLWTLRLATLATLIGAWELVARLKLVDPFWISQPSRIYGRLITDLVSSTFWLDMQTTAIEIVAGVALGTIAGVVIGIMFGYAYRAYQVIEPIVMALYTLPRIVLAPLFIIWFGIGITSKVALVFSLVVFIMLLNAYVGVRTVDRDLIDSVRTMGANRLFLARRVILPAALPFITTGLRLSFVYGLGGAVVGEMLIARNGLGVLITASSSTFDTTGVFEILAILFVWGFAMNEAISWVERRLLSWNAP